MSSDGFRRCLTERFLGFDFFFGSVLSGLWRRRLQQQFLGYLRSQSWEPQGQPPEFETDWVRPLPYRSADYNFFVIYYKGDLAGGGLNSMKGREFVGKFVKSGVLLSASHLKDEILHIRTNLVVGGTVVY
uniref:Uncharacterized protein n=1 Tax=Chromera velia CCMP2878 TaxID=1169474 RepID=A0A0G4GNC1_9ALVE|eukprot:Cvel_4967.t1-p1 / transcript=Cvel_4967.t1 / gene=Cvel_4967 / organism=Chromera_velia_CCMP2878 / gene_product=hypothetical protein / transcript_product=hypothetical protein / location=Cvel_scaffold224:106828-117749(-) / protein_length=129 / sequence_SO=supercontig / SO=protein_coding / is_pseudo=false